MLKLVLRWRGPKVRGTRRTVSSVTTVLGCTLGISANTDTIRQAKGLGLGRCPRNKQTNKQLLQAVFELEITLEKYRKSLKTSDFLLDFLIPIHQSQSLAKASQLGNFSASGAHFSYLKSSNVGKSYSQISVKNFWTF